MLVAMMEYCEKLNDKIADAYREVYALGYENGYFEGKKETLKKVYISPPEKKVVYVKKNVKRIVLRDIYDETGEYITVFSVTADVTKAEIESIIESTKSIDDYSFEDLEDMLKRVLKDRFLGFESLGDEEVWW